MSNADLFQEIVNADKIELQSVIIDCDSVNATGWGLHVVVLFALPSEGTGTFAYLPIGSSESEWKVGTLQDVAIALDEEKRAFDDYCSYS